MTLFSAMILGIIEGITEFLPISSTGHLILASQLLGVTQDEFFKSFEIIIQLGAILSVVFLYWREFLNFSILQKLFIAFLPTGLIGLTFYSFVKTYLLEDEYVVLWALFLGGLFLIVFELFHKEKRGETGSVHSITLMQSFFVGLFQAIAIIPGTSRSAATIIGGLLMGLPRVAIVEFSFLLAVPTMLAATGLDIVESASTFSYNQFGILATGFIISFIVALFSIKFLLGFIRKHSFIPFGIYRVVLALAFWLIIL